MRILAAAILVCVLATTAAAGEPGTATVEVKDGDSLVIGGMEIRLEGFDAPEWSRTDPAWRQFCTMPGGATWPCGQRATAHMEQLVAGQRITCTLTGRRSYGRPHARCFTDAGDLGELMARAGWAAIDPKYPGPYDADAAEARAAQRGIWRGRFTLPRLWRRQIKVRNRRP